MGSMYDPYREEYDGYNPLVENQQERAKIFKEIAELYQRFNDCGITKKFPDLSAGLLEREEAELRAKLPPLMNVADARQEAIELWRYATGGINHGYDTEYYSACGMDDYIGERMDYARSKALAIWRCVGRFD